MARYRSRGGFRLLMKFSPALAVFRMALLAAAIVVYPAKGLCMLLPLVSLAAAAGALYLDRRLGLARRSGRIMNACANAAWLCAACIIAALRSIRLRFPACVLLVLLLAGLTAGICKSKQPAL